MGIELTTNGGGKYSAPMIETIEIAAEKGFAVSPIKNPDGSVELMSYDDFYSSDSSEF